MGSCRTCLLIFSSLVVWTYYYTAASAQVTLKPGDTLKPGESLNSTTWLCSAMGTFCLGFCVYDKSNSSQLCIWGRDTSNTGWIASRDKPVLYPTGVLTLDKNKTLKIMDQGRTRLELYSASRETANTNTSTVVATLLDSGNFILQEVNTIHGSKNRILWQSFDHPTDTLYPGMMLGVNHRNGHMLSLTSWSSDYNPKPEPFTLEWDYKTQELQIKRRGVVYWTSGALTSKRFKLLRRRYNFSIVSNKNEDYFSYYSLSQTSASEWYLTSSGLLFDYGGVDIARADNCYGYNTDGGCQRWAEKPTCRHVGDIFELKTGFFKPTTTNSTPDSTFPSDSNESLSISDCKDSCWKNCECLGYTFLNADDESGCQYYTGINWEFIQDFTGDGTQNFNMLKTKSPHSNGTKKRIFIGTGITVATLLLMVPCIACYVLRRRKFALSGEKETNIIEDELLDLMRSDRPTDANALGYAWELWKEGTVLELMDPALGDSCIKDQLLRCVHVGLLCVEENAADRPTMSDVVSMLTNQSTPLPLPAKAAFFTGRNVVENGSSGKKSEFFSSNEISDSTAAWELWKEGTVLELMDPTLGDSCIKDQLLRCVHVTLLCVEEIAADRPTMFVSMLTNQSTPLPLPGKPAFFTGRNVVEAGLSGKKSEIFSTNELSNSTDNLPDQGTQQW
ncbi:hypothetical protein DVH24_021886 [Malus domestica]|uniref:Bulb-type lectin domain-containing protein n=1 Tax=Malus domestica TaxID=3750 RepID=A0A498IYP9_MALDO|nr:hypothetical protein DVH24_021886 [Malus domestica]